MKTIILWQVFFLHESDPGPVQDTRRKCDALYLPKENALSSRKGLK